MKNKRKCIVHLWLGQNRTVTACGLLSHRHSNFLASGSLKGSNCVRCKNTNHAKGIK
jgi:hypothetical protein